jgi:hypothetical protein
MNGPQNTDCTAWKLCDGSSCVHCRWFSPCLSLLFFTILTEEFGLCLVLKKRSDPPRETTWEATCFIPNFLLSVQWVPSFVWGHMDGPQGTCDGQRKHACVATSDLQELAQLGPRLVMIAFKIRSSCKSCCSFSPKPIFPLLMKGRTFHLCIILSDFFKS